MRFCVLILTLFSMPLSLAAQGELPRVLVLATGGTIAGEQRDPGTQEAYEIRRPISEIVASVPEARRYARIETEQFANIPSTNVSPANWLQLARRINTVFRERPDLSGIVVTHGTARLEETAFFAPDRKVGSSCRAVGGPEASDGDQSGRRPQFAVRHPCGCLLRVPRQRLDDRNGRADPFGPRR
jgi:hypothetical protein